MGLRQAAGYERAALTGVQWQSIELALQAEQPFPRTLNALAEPKWPRP
jgi:pyridoxine 5-phosphate synthase/DNA repair protein RecO (recombination protein O)